MRKWECTVCGYIHEGEEPPEECPVCSAEKSLFVEIIEDTAPSGEPEALQVSQPPVAPAGKPSLLASIYAFASKQIVKHHLHPIAVHTPNGVLPMALIFLLITAILGYPLFETAAFYSMVFVLLFIPIVLFTGYEIWQNRYRGALTPIFKIKITASTVTLLLLITLVIWRIIQPEIMTTTSTGRWIYLTLSTVMVMAVGLAGHMGGKLVFGNRKNVETVL